MQLNQYNKYPGFIVCCCCGPMSLLQHRGTSNCCIHPNVAYCKGTITPSSYKNQAFYVKHAILDFPLFTVHRLDSEVRSMRFPGEKKRKYGEQVIPRIRSEVEKNDYLNFLLRENFTDCSTCQRYKDQQSPLRRHIQVRFI